MTHFISDHYLLIKSFHILSVMAWMAGMLYLPRLFVYHAQEKPGSETAETFKIMERRLLRGIMNPAMIAAWVFGLTMLAGNPSLLESGWMHVKLTGVILMTVLHHLYGRWRKIFERDENKRSARFYKIWNEVPTALMIVIVIVAVTKAF